MKKTVFFKLADYWHIVVGQSAIVKPINHSSKQVSNTKPVKTSKVLSYDKENNSFETLNSIYVGVSQ